ncbi:MAG: hypothetical protein IKS36_01760 [Bacteroidales bacterium]|nr:hypothetical protein [Bacteroidales bacterium]
MLHNEIDLDNELDSSEIVDESLLEEMGISRQVYEEVMSIVGHLPTVDELGTLVEMWKSQRTRQGLLEWLKGQFHAVECHDYLENELEPESRQYQEPEVRECIEIARKLFEGDKVSRNEEGEKSVVGRGDALYMVGDVSAFFTNSEYGRRYLHLVDNPMVMDGDEETANYIELILESLRANDALFGYRRIGRGGLFRTLMGVVAPQRFGFDILTCREVRLDAFLFGEQGVRFLAMMDEQREDFFLQKLVEARVNCCFLGRVTKDRIVVDGVDFGRSAAYITK